MGGEAGAAAVIGIGILLGATPVGWAIVAGAILGSIVVGFFASAGGRQVGRDLYDLF